MTASRLDQRDIDDTFAIFEKDQGTVHRHLISRLYLRPRDWHDVHDPDGDTLLIAAARQGHDTAVDLLLKRNFPAESWNNRLETALHITGSAITASLLIGKTNSRLALEANIDGDLPLHIHLREGNVEIAKVLLADPTADAQIMRKNVKGETPLFEAARHQPERVLGMLLLGADPRVRNKEGASAADVTRDKPTARKLEAFCSHLDRCDEALREQALADREAQRKVNLAQQAKIFLGAPSTAALPASIASAI